MKLNNEIWEKIPNIDYYISNCGRIKNKDGLILKTFGDKDGYRCIKIHTKQINKHYKIHRLVAQAFLNNYNDSLQVNHINGIKDDNRIENLEMVTSSQNVQHSHYVLKNRIKKVYQYDLNGNFISEWINAKEIEKKLGFKQYNICRVCNNKRKTAHGFKWSYNEI